MKRRLRAILLLASAAAVAGLASAQSAENPGTNAKAVGTSAGPRFLAKGANSSWSPDGIRIVFSSRAGSGGLKVIDLNTGKIADLLAKGKDPVWSPKDGRWIAYVRFGSGNTEEIWLVEPTGKNPRKLAEGGYPTWSADGKTVFYQSRKLAKVMAIRVDVKDAKATEVFGTSWWYPAVSPDGKLVATRVDEQAFVIDAKTGKVIRMWPLRYGRGFLPGWSPDSKRVAFGGYGQTMGLWVLDIQTGMAVRVPTRGFTRPAWSQDGLKLSFDLRAGSEEIWVMDSKGLAALKPVKQPGSPLATQPLTPIPSAPPAPGGSQVSQLPTRPSQPDVSSVPGATKTRLVLKGHGSRVESLAFSPDGKTVASASRDGTIKLWDAATGQLRQTLRGHAGRVHAVAFSPNGKTLASGGSDNTVKLWDIETGKETATLAGHTDLVTSVAFATDGKTLVSASQDHAIKVWDVAAGKEQQTLNGHTYAVTSVALSPDGKALASGSEDATIKLWDLENGRLRSTLTGHTGWLTCVHYSPDGKTLASSSNDGKIKLWETGTGQLRTTCTGHTLSATCVAFSSDGKLLATGGKDRTVRLWDAATGKPRETLTGHTGWLRSVAFSPDNRTLASAGSDTTIRLWNLVIKKMAEDVTPTTPKPPDVPAAGDYALLFDGRRSHVTIPGLRYDGSHPITLEAFVTPISENPANALGVRHMLRDFGSVVADIEGGGVNLRVVRRGYQMEVRDSAGYPHAGCTRAAADETRAHLAGVFDGARMRIYVDGKLRGKAPLTAKFVRSQSDFMIGANPNSGGRIESQFRGIIDELRASRIARYEADFTPAKRFQPDRDTMALYHFDEGSGWVARDASGNGYHGQIQEAQWIGANTYTTPDAVVTATSAATLFGHTKRVYNAIFSPDGQTLASCGEGHMVQLWDVPARRLLKTLKGHTNSVCTVAFSPDGRTLASSGFDHTVKLWDVHTGQLKRTLVGNTNAVWSVAFSPDGQILASGCVDHKVRLWDVPSGQLRNTLQGHNSGIGAIAFTPDGETLASGSFDRTVGLWDVETGQLRATLRGHASDVHAVAVSADGKTLASGDGGGTIILWDVTTAEQSRSFVAHANLICFLAFSPDGKTLASGCDSRLVKLFDAATGQPRAVLTGHDGNVHGVAFAPDGKTLATASRDRSIKLWDLPLTAPPAPQKPQTLDLAGEFPVTLKTQRGEIPAVVYSPDGKTVAAVGDGRVVQLLDATTGEVQAEFGGHGGKIWSVAFSPDGKTLATGSDDRTIMLWDAQSGQRRATIGGHSRMVRVVTFSPDGKTLASGSDDGTVRLWSTLRSAHLTTLTGHSRRVTALAFSPDGKTLASGGWDNTIRIWDTQPYSRRASLLGHTKYLRHVVFSPDGKTLASSSNDQTIRLWDVETNQLRTVLHGHSDQVSSVVFAPDGNSFASTSQDQTVKLWDVATGKVSATLHGHFRQSLFAAFSPDGRTLVSSGADGTVRFWDLAAFEKLPARYAVPNGDTTELLKYIETLKAYHPKTYHQHVEHTARSHKAILAAAEAILKLEKDGSTEAFQTAALVVLKHDVATLANADPDDHQQILSDVKKHLARKVGKGLTLEDLSMAASTADALMSHGSGELAEDAYGSFARLIAAGNDTSLSGLTKSFERAARRCALLGKGMDLQGTTLAGTALDWKAYRGKVVLVDFCDTRSPDWRAELPNVRKNYQLYHARGFDVVRISSDSDRAAVERFFRDEKYPWGVTLHDDTTGKHPLAEHYGVTTYPTALLVDKQGKVVSLRAYGTELDEQLAKRLGSPFAPKGKLTPVHLQSHANRALAESWAKGPGNDLSELPRGEQTLAGVKFKIGDGMIQLGSRARPEAPEKVTGIEVNRNVAGFYILHSMEWGATSAGEGTYVGRYEVHYEDQSVETIYIVKGEDVRDWWGDLHPAPVSRGKLLWAGHNPASRRGNRYIRLFLCVWENPKPDTKILSIDFISTMTTGASPFCVAITAEATASAAGDK